MGVLQVDHVSYGVCTWCGSVYHSYANHARNCHGRKYPAGYLAAQMPGGDYGEPEVFHFVTALGLWQNGWTDIGGTDPDTAFRLTWDGDLQLVLAADPGNYAVPMFVLPAGWIPASSWTLLATANAGAQVFIGVQGLNGTAPGTVTPTKAGALPPATLVRASLRIPMFL